MRSRRSRRLRKRSAPASLGGRHRARLLRPRAAGAAEAAALGRRIPEAKTERLDGRSSHLVRDLKPRPAKKGASIAHFGSARPPTHCRAFLAFRAMRRSCRFEISGWSSRVASCALPPAMRRMNRLRSRREDRGRFECCRAWPMSIRVCSRNARPCASPTSRVGAQIRSKLFTIGNWPGKFIINSYMLEIDYIYVASKVWRDPRAIERNHEHWLILTKKLE